MNPQLFIDVDPAMLYLPTTRQDGADLLKYQLQVARYGTSTARMPPPLCLRGIDGTIQLVDGVTRATRVAKLLPGKLIRVEIDLDTCISYRHLNTVKDKLP